MSEASLGLASGIVRIVAYDSRWPAQFDVAAAEIRDAIGDAALAIHHVGSTSVPGLCGKPILDILVTVANLPQSLELVPQLEAVGYEYRPENDIPDRHYFRRLCGALRTHHLSLAEADSHHHTATLAFRNALRADPEKAREYCALKRELALRFPRDRENYTEGKTSFVRRVLREAGVEEIRAI